MPKILVTIRNLDRLPMGPRKLGPLTSTVYGNLNPDTGHHEVTLSIEEWIAIAAEVTKDSGKAYCRWAMAGFRAEPDEREAQLLGALELADAEVTRLKLMLSGRSDGSAGEPPSALGGAHETKAALETPVEPPAETPGIKTPGFRGLRVIAIRHKMPGYADITKKADMLALVLKYAPEELTPEAAALA